MALAVGMYINFLDRLLNIHVGKNGLLHAVAMATNNIPEKTLSVIITEIVDSVLASGTRSLTREVVSEQMSFLAC